MKPVPHLFLLVIIIHYSDTDVKQSLCFVLNSFEYIQCRSNYEELNVVSVVDYIFWLMVSVCVRVLDVALII